MDAMTSICCINNIITSSSGDVGKQWILVGQYSALKTIGDQYKTKDFPTSGGAGNQIQDP